MIMIGYNISFLIDLSSAIFYTKFYSFTSSLFLSLDYCSRSQVIFISIVIFTDKFDFWKVSQI